MPDRAKSSTWSSTVAGTLSIHSPKIFKSGQVIFNETGWWGLQEITSPKTDHESYKIQKTAPLVYTPSRENVNLESDKNYGRGKRKRKDKKFDFTAASNVSKSDVDKSIGSMQQKKERTDLLNGEITSKIKIYEECNTEENKYAILTNDCLPLFQNPIVAKQETGLVKIEPVDFNFVDPLSPNLLQLGELSSEFSCFSDTIPDGGMYLTALDNSFSSSLLQDGSASFKASSMKTELVEDRSSLGENDCQRKITIPLTPKQELEFLDKINCHAHVLELDSSVCRLRQKLMVRKKKREMGIKVFNLDVFVHDLLKEIVPENMIPMFQDSITDLYQHDSINNSLNRSYHHPVLHSMNILDRFYNLHNYSVTNERSHHSAFVCLIGNAEERVYSRRIVSPYTSRVLKPYIRRDFVSLPPKLKVLRAIQSRSINAPAEVKRYPIDFCYVQPNHIPAVNALCADFFWPGIDLTECLQYPDFSCVVLYRKLLIGFAFMVPDVKYNEAYISFILVHPDWQRAGIATNMIYHLIQTCMGKDITLHVSPTNPSMMLYQKFGFKTEELIIKFYEKYITYESKECKHAFLLRLQR